MSEKLPQSNQSEEVDLGQLFKLIGNMFERLFNFIKDLFKGLFLAFIWLVFFTKKHTLKLFIAGIIGIAIGVFFDKTSDPIYKSYITVKQNYKTGENLYNSISYYNDLVQQQDVSTLSEVLGIKPNESSSILKFEIESVISENDKVSAYNEYIQTLDSVVAATVGYKDFLDRDKDYNHQYQQVTIKSKVRSNFKVVFDKIIESVNSNKYFKREQAKDISELEAKKLYLENSLLESKSLQNTYKEVLTKPTEQGNSSQASLYLKTFKEEAKTKEFDLYLNDLELKEVLVEVQRKITDKTHILEITSSKQDTGLADNRKEVFGKYIGLKLYYGLMLLLITFLILISIEFYKYLERYNNKV